MRVGNHIYRKQMVVPTMLKFVLFGPFYSKIGLDPCITVVKETKKNIYISIFQVVQHWHCCLPLKVSVQLILSTHKKESVLVEESISKYYRIPPVIIKNLVARTDILLVNMLMALVGFCFALVTIF